jgi:chromosome segregation protein
MFLKRLEIQGFKSFANKTTMEFDRGVIAIVGPNGSGKSNVADSLRWVLGEQSAKMIRGKASQDVIFAGSEKKIKMGFAEVIATFDNSDRRIPVDSAEVAIGRRIDRSGESEYLINGNRVRLLDIVDLVLKSNIGTSRYTVIGQGTIDQMILAGPSEVKNLIDEASGVKTYYMKREKTLRRLEQTAQNLMRAEDLIKEIEPRLKSLRRQAKRMEARTEIETELKIYQREFFGKTYWSLKVILDSFNAKLSEYEKERHVLEQDLSAHRSMLEQQEQLGTVKNQEFKALEERLHAIHGQKNKLLEELSLIRGKMQSQKTGSSGDAQTLEVELHNKTTKLKELQGKIEESQNQQKTLTEQVSGHRRNLEEINSKLDRLYGTIQNPTQVDWIAFDRELVGLENSFETFYVAIDRAQDMSVVKQQADSFKQSFVKFTTLAKNSVSGPQVNMQQLQVELQNLLKQKESLNAEVQNLELGLTKSNLSLEFLNRELHTVEQERLPLDLELKKAQSGSFESFVQELIVQEEQIKKQIEDQDKEIVALEQSVKDLSAAENAKQKDLHEAESRFRAQQDKLSKIKDLESGVQIEKAKIDTQMEVLYEEVYRILGQEIFENIKQAPVEGSTEDLENKISRLKNQLDMIGGMDELTLKEYQETETRYTTLFSQVEDLKHGMQDLRNIMDELDEHIKVKFNEAFHKINEKFEYYFRILFNGGRATLGVVKSEEAAQAGVGNDNNDDNDSVGTESQLRPEEKIVKKYEKGANNIVGIDIKATPPGKKLTHIQALSGGERSLTSIALLCSMLTCFPSPFVVLDEVDAALDDANTIRFGQILGTLAHQTQFITITHNRETMSQANILYGVTMGDDGISKLLSVKLEQAKAFAK